MKDPWSQYFQESLAAQASQQRLRTRGASASRSEETDSKVLDFGSNDYLGLRKHPQVLSQLQQGVLGSGSSPVLAGGYTSAHTELERCLARLCKTQDALLFSSGYACNVGVVSCLGGARDLILSDALNHASLIDGCRLSRAHVRVFPHRDVSFVENFLRTHRDEFERVLVVTESIFSMDGDAAPLVELSDICRRLDAGLLVDEAHALGVYGERGSGLVEHLGLESQILVKLGTLSKSVGAIGGYACGSQELIDFLINHCRSYLFSTSPPIPLMAAIQSALEIIEAMQDERQALRRKSQRVRQWLGDHGWTMPDGSSLEGDSPIIPVLVGDESEAIRLSAHLLANQIYVPAIRPPTVPAGLCRLRISLSCRHSQEDLDRLMSCLKDCPVG